jgi:hypothetical protein
MKTILGLLIFISTFGAWVTHIVVSIKAAAWTFMLVGIFLPPIAVFHGWATWLGYTWV